MTLFWRILWWKMSCGLKRNWAAFISYFNSQCFCTWASLNMIILIYFNIIIILNIPFCDMNTIQKLQVFNIIRRKKTNKFLSRRDCQAGFFISEEGSKKMTEKDISNSVKMTLISSVSPTFIKIPFISKIRTRFRYLH